MQSYNEEGGVRSYANLRQPHIDPLPSTHVQCDACGAEGYPQDKYCACCGGQVHRQCGECGSRIAHPVAHYCAQCGARLDPQDS